MTLILSGTDGLSDVDGSAATPAIRGTDANTGIFFPAADTIAFAEGGVERARIDSSGNLGLGVIPSPWNTFTASFQIDGASLSGLGANNTALASNAYYQSAWKYYGTGSASLYQQNAGQHAWSVAGSGTAGNAITFTQALTLNANGALALQGAASANGIGITFPATQSASSDANTLDDYEEGTWTPALAGEGGGSNTFISKYGYYTKIGRLVTVTFTTSAISSPNAQTNSWNITGLPFQSANLSALQAVLWAGSFSHYRQFPVQASSTGLFPSCRPNTATLRISVMYGGPAQTESIYVTGGTPSATLEITGTITYETA